MRLFLVAILVTAGCSRSTGPLQHEVTAEWQRRLIESLEAMNRSVDAAARNRALQDETLIANFGAMSLAVAGYHDEAKDIIDASHEGKAIPVGYSFLADAQATGGYLAESLQTAQLVKGDSFRERTIGLIATRTAQRGEFDAALAVLKSMKAKPRIEHARESIASAMLKAGHFGEALGQYSLLTAPNRREMLRFAFARARQRISPEDNNFVERTVETEKLHPSGLSDSEIAVRRVELTIERAKWCGEELDVSSYIDAAIALLNADASDQNTLEKISLAACCERSGEIGKAHRLVTGALETMKSSGPISVSSERFFITSALAASNRMNVIGKVLHDTELVDATIAFSKLGDVVDTLGPLAFGIARARRFDAAVDCYESLESPSQRAQFATGIINGLHLPEFPYTPAQPRDWFQRRLPFAAAIDKILAENSE